MDTRRIGAAVLLVAGVVLVFYGFSAAMRFSAVGIIGGVAAIVTLLYAGAVWFGGSPSADAAGLAEPLIVFDRAMRIASGARRGTPVTMLFPESSAREIEMRCAAALGGQAARFTCEVAAQAVVFDAAPVRAANGTVVYGVLISAGAGSPAQADVAGLS
jgi:hypothetical protein